MKVETPLKMKKPWLAGLLNLISPGLGFVYVGTVGWILGGIILLLFTLGGKFTPVVWPFTGAGIPQISAWIGLVIFTTPLCTYGARRKNRKIMEKAELVHVPPQPSTSQLVTDSVTYCPSCGVEVKSRYVFCAKCGESVKTSPSQLDTIQDKCHFCGFEIQSGDIFCENCGEFVKTSPSQLDTIQDKCHFCGFEIQSGDIFCENCGKKVAGSDTGEPNVKELEKKGAIGTESLSNEASNYISEALNVIESQVVFGSRSYVVASGGSEGKVMEAARKFKEVYQLHLENPLLHYAYASCLHLAAQYKSAEDEMRKCIEAYPDFILARLALEGWKNWMPMFILPPWKQESKTVHPVLSHIIKTFVLLPVRDGIVPRAALFLRDTQGAFQNPQALQSAKISLASVISPVRDPQIIGIYARIYDNPVNPLDLEYLQFPFLFRGNKTRSAYEYLCIQEDIDFVVIDRNDCILLNKRLPIPQNMRTTNGKIFKMLEASDGIEIPNSQLVNATFNHQQKFALSDVLY